MTHALASRGLRPVQELAASREHGDRLRYMAGCKCFDCRKANSNYETTRAVARENGDWNGLVSADRARAHLVALQRAGVGRRAISTAAGVAFSVVHEVRIGRKKMIRARTEKKLLAVTKAARAEGALVSAKRTWRLIEELVDEGYTRGFLAKQLGYEHQGLQFGKARVTGRIARDVERLHVRLTK